MCRFTAIVHGVAAFSRGADLLKRSRKGVVKTGVKVSVAGLRGIGLQSPHRRQAQGETMPEVHWVKSSYSFANGNCCEVAALPGGDVGVRDSKDPEGPVLRFTRDEWAAFLDGAKAGEFGHLPA